MIDIGLEDGYWRGTWGQKQWPAAHKKKKKPKGLIHNQSSSISIHALTFSAMVWSLLWAEPDGLDGIESSTVNEQTGWGKEISEREPYKWRFITSHQVVKCERIIKLSIYLETNNKRRSEIGELKLMLQSSSILLLVQFPSADLTSNPSSPCAAFDGHSSPSVLIDIQFKGCGLVASS
jgi:hypothetical protein